MSKSVHYRLPDQLLEDARKYGKANGVTVTDVIIQGLQAVLYSEEPKKPECHDKADAEIVAPGAFSEVKTPVIIKNKADIPEIRRNRPTISHHPGCTCGVCQAHKSA